MRDTIIKVIKIALACALVFMVAAPLIVGVYDAYNGRDSIGDSGGGATGYIRYDFGGANAVHREANDVGLLGDVSSSDDDGQDFDARSGGDSGLLHQSLPYGGTSQASGDSSRQVQGDYGDGSSGTYGYEAASLMDEDSLSVADWYSGDTRISDLFRSGSAHLVYDFADGTTVDFGNPYVLGWNDVPMPDDYDSAVAGDDGSLSFLAPEKAYAGPISYIGNKLKMLAIKSGYWKSFNSMVYSCMVTVCMSAGMTYTAATETVSKFIAEMPAITRVISSETVTFSTEDTAMLVSEAISRVAARGVPASEAAAAVDAEIAAEVTAVETTGQLLGGGTGNFINALYQLAETGGVPASILNSDIALYLGSWLGGQFDIYDDLPNVDAPVGVTTVKLNEIDFIFPSISQIPVMQYDKRSFYVQPTWSFVELGLYEGRDYFYPTTSGVILQLYYSNDLGYYLMPYQRTVDQTFTALSSYDESGNSKGTKNLSGQTVYEMMRDGISVTSGVDIDVYDCTGSLASRHNIIYDASSSTWNTDLVSVVNSPSDSQLFEGQIVGAGAQYDDAGNITDYGNVTVPNVFAPDYVAPGTYAEALNQMNATATQDSHATANSPAFGQSEGTTVKDWTEANKPTTPEPGTESGQDDFRVEDLEKVFPFCLPWDVYYLFSALSADPVAPAIDFPLNFSVFGLDDYRLHVDFSEYESFAVALRAIEVLGFCLGLALVTRNLIRG